MDGNFTIWNFYFNLTSVTAERMSEALFFVMLSSYIFSFSKCYEFTIGRNYNITFAGVLADNIG